MGKVNRQFFIWSFSGLIITSAIWLVVGNLIAAQQEQKIDAAKEQFRKQFPNTEANNSALKLEELTAKLGVPINPGLKTTPTRYLHSYGYEAKAKQFQDIQKELGDYLDAQLGKPTDEIDIPPEKLRKYLSSNASLLEAVQNHVLNSELPQWEIEDISNLTVEDALPSFLVFANFQRLLTLNILEKTRLGQNKEALNSLEVSWKLNQFLVKRPEFIAQLVAIIIARQATSVMRKMSNLPTVWQSRIERVAKYHLPQSFLTPFVIEAFFFSNTARTIPVSNFKEILDYQKRASPAFLLRLPELLTTLIYGLQGYSDYYPDIPDSIDLSVLNPLYKPYFRLAGVDSWEKMNQTVRELPKEYLCSFEPEEFAKNYKIAPASWNLVDTSLVSQWRKVIKIAVQMELTQKILRIKEIANKQGNWPQQIPGIETSAICKDAKWIYQVSENGTMSISLSKEFDWLQEKPEDSNYIPLNYSAKYKRNLNLK
ncbi:hypothetical protein Cylst_5718 [Cylindrospermum stagnale PCC 7417]|uniref:Uncharacterized protein n=1 Tax=Cylindrospermum stagnale PCC 7417 TaxID=56107 RepID=K9X6I9_9NOST|nr:hypothetical protein [Cylindrospermum stagnale]AFZ27714.1 hypothetical protein Cylst_5718 [Cylindrospermum stagnale PCC 7417]